MAKRKNGLFGYLPISLDLATLLMRLVGGGMMFYAHGYPKMMKLSGNGPITFADPIGIGEFWSLLLAIFAEVVCSVLVILGLFTRLAVIPLIVTMLVVILVVNKTQPLENHELSGLYTMIFVALLFSGPGKYSLDARIKK